MLLILLYLLDKFIGNIQTFAVYWITHDFITWALQSKVGPLKNLLLYAISSSLLDTSLLIHANIFGKYTRINGQKVFNIYWDSLTQYDCLNAARCFHKKTQPS